MNAGTALQNIREEFGPPILHLEEVLRGIRAGRATTGLVENIEVTVYGSRMPLKAAASLSTPDPKTILVEPWDKTHLKEIEKALSASPIGVNPQTSGTLIRLNIPPLTEERRAELTRLVRQRLEEAKASIRHVREKLLKDLRSQKEAGTLSDDAFEREKKRLQGDTDAAVAAVVDISAAKESEMLAT